MNVSKLGLSFTSSVLAIALSVAPVHGAIAAPAEDDTGEGDDAEGDADAPAEGDDAAPEDGEGDPVEGDATDEGDPAEGDATGEGDPAEGDATGEGDATESDATGEGDPAEGDATGEGDPAEGDATGEGDPADEGEVDASEDTEVEVGEEDMEGEDELAIVDEGPLRPPEPAWGPKKQYPMNGKGALITGGVVAGLGVVGIVTSLLVTRCDFEASLSCRYNDQREFLIPLTVTITGLGLMLVGVGIGNKIKYKKWENWDPDKTAVVPTMMRGGGGLAWVGRF